MLHASIKRVQHHSRVPRVCLEHLCALTETLDDDDKDVQTVMTQMAALTTQSQQTAHTTAKTSASVVVAIHQLAANQQTMQQQFAAFTMQCNTTFQWAQAVKPPITQFSQQRAAVAVDVVAADVVHV
jgi:ABC-type transporter Mla subunit MlaD